MVLYGFVRFSSDYTAVLLYCPLWFYMFVIIPKNFETHFAMSTVGGKEFAQPYRNKEDKVIQQYNPLKDLT